MVNLVIDLDGCLIDSSEVQRKALMDSYDEVVGDGGAPSYDEWIKYTGDSIEGALTKMGLPVEMADIYRRVSSVAIDSIQPSWEAIAFVREMRSMGARCALCTGKDRKRTDEILDRYCFADCFDALVCSDEIAEPKPSAIPVCKAAELMKVELADCVVIGDGLNDILSAQAAGVTSVLTTWFGDQGVPRVADYTADSVGKLRDIILNLV